MAMMKVRAVAERRRRAIRPLCPSSCPGLSRPSTFLTPAPKSVDARDKPGHDDGEFGSFRASLILVTHFAARTSTVPVPVRP
nr:hypothetical protein FJN17_10480 [Bradyrhizobium symbiodeficiens]